MGIYFLDVDTVSDVTKGIKRMDEYFPISAELHLMDSCNLNCEWCTDKELRRNKATFDIQVIGKLFKEFWQHGTGFNMMLDRLENVHTKGFI